MWGANLGLCVGVMEVAGRSDGGREERWWRGGEVVC